MRFFPWLVLSASTSLFSSAALAQSAEAADGCPAPARSESPSDELDAASSRAACYEQTGKLASAYAVLIQAVSAAKASADSEREQVARARAEALWPRLSKLSIFVLPSQLGRVEVALDGELIDERHLGLLVPVDAGSHHVRVFGAGLVPWSMEINVPTVPGEHTVMVPVLVEKTLGRRLHSGIVAAPPHDEPHERSSFLAPTHRKVAVAAGSVGALGVSVGTIFGLRAISKSDESERRGCVGSVCPTVEGVEARRQAELSSTVATVSTIAGLTGLAAAAALFLLASDDDDDDDQLSSSLAPRFAADGGELRWRGRF